MARLHTSLVSLKNAQVKRFAQMSLDAKGLVHHTAKEGFKDELSATSGRLSYRDLARMGHPYGRLNGPNSMGRGLLTKKNPSVFGGMGKYGKQITRKGVVRSLPINKHTGELRRNMRLTSGRNGREYDLFVARPDRNYVLLPTGTRKMIGRGLLGPTGLLRKRHRARMAAYVEFLRKQHAGHP